MGDTQWQLLEPLQSLLEGVLTDQGADNPGFNFATTYTYDAVGRQISETDALGHITQYAYDELGRLVKTRFADGTSTTSTYNELGRKINAS